MLYGGMFYTRPVVNIFERQDVRKMRWLEISEVLGLGEVCENSGKIAEKIEIPNFRAH